MANQYQRVSPGMYRGQNGQLVRSQQMPQARPTQRQQPQTAPPLQMLQQQFNAPAPQQEQFNYSSQADQFGKMMPQPSARGGIDPMYSMGRAFSPPQAPASPQMQWAMQKRDPNPQGPQGILSQPPMMNQMGQMMGGLYKR